ncbi:malonate decarboxylase subunit epsilon [Pseudazoarcus pumilus]|uniref:Malonate decarboxylase subunit epsilon n=2 Tax=Pseudazoarcus pumilus TaxID=2067960 RepID=A0A2I6SA62_9RHOO|nr:malonate decarboxylase subunit epsilon [Pseudazoarcus pumilus]
MFGQLAREPAAGEVLDLVSAQLGFDVRTMAERVTESELCGNRIAQLLVVGHALATVAALRAEGVRPALCAGYSVGEMAAHGAAGVWDAQTTLALTALRAQNMDAAAAAACGPLCMSAVIGIDAVQAEALAPAHGAALAIVNGPRHVVIGGPEEAVERFERQAPEYGATHLRRLSVSLASHTHFIAAAVPPFAAALSAANWARPRATLLSGLDGRALMRHEDTVAWLSRQICEPLQWHDCLQSMIEYGVDVVLEIGPGRALTRMIEEDFPGIRARASDEFRSVAGSAAWLARNG